MVVNCAHCSNFMELDEDKIIFNDTREGLLLTCVCPICKMETKVDSNFNNYVIKMAFLKKQNYSAYVLVKRMQELVRQENQLLQLLQEIKNTKDETLDKIQILTDSLLTDLWYEPVIIDKTRHRRSSKYKLDSLLELQKKVKD